MNLTINVVEETKKSIVNLSGEIDAYTAPQLKETLLPLTQQRGNIVEVDLENVTYMDSTGLGIFISALKSTKEHESMMRLVNIQDRVLRLFKITGLDEIMDINAAIRGGSE
ncbi:MAG: STAS domain-containing protein [Bacillota bacterium]|uniref:Anti-sigma factor antagonist n=1 Tax=Virgibacillus salarius TaxID=447199 RepID=A0A941DV22_9BACI|nr:MULTISPECIES: STAS domain-containing protein [Virgibacillus]NAZ08959.1 anti-sigma factor antagonist [Agaribacter marinus]MBR7796251.1 STAS domain-containing protein [Virgibacillus salarius]MCC2251648.1 STAS domain-containing protein [Virgibacillus sp. AGTR]MDY7045160.1 STAS domain-containing protein [Virgibacillus sp. M23]QRZ19681.1 STAS domain-containing protein [Virgibacillus sp. AGTR]